jgi:predicted acylesterase/phospholipase RssA
MSEVKKRSLILAGGGMKVAFQAGVLQVWLDEARLDGVSLTFDHADGASGGTFNLAMYCQGMSGVQIADNWRSLNPLRGVDFNWDEYPKLLYARSVFEFDRYREDVLQTLWQLDWDRINASDKEATFNVYNFSKHQLEVLTPDAMSEDFLAACVSLPIWFPPVMINGDNYIDAVFVTDANIEEAIQRHGADELWIIWTVSERGEWNDGFVANYFQIIESAANGQLQRMLARIDENNAAIARGESGEFDRLIEAKILRAEVPLHYIINLSSDRIKEAVDRGVQAAREWCLAQGMLLEAQEDQHTEDPTKLWFTEEMKGYVTFGKNNFEQGFWKGRETGTLLTSHLKITVDDVDRFVTHREHEGRTEGYVRFELPDTESPLNGQFPVHEGRFNLFEDREDPEKRDPARKRMLYRLFFEDKEGKPFTLSGYKEIIDDPGADLWEDTTTLFTRIFEGHVGPENESNVEPVASGKITIHLRAFLKLLTTFRVDGPTATQEGSALARFGLLFLGNLWDVYARRVLSSSPF